MRLFALCWFHRTAILHMAMLILSAVTAISTFATSPIEVAPEFVRGGLTERPMRARYTRLGFEPISFSVDSVLPDSQSPTG